jgi:hypothetical protein
MDIVVGPVRVGSIGISSASLRRMPPGILAGLAAPAGRPPQ